MGFDIFKVEHLVYDRKKASLLVLKSKSFGEPHKDKYEEAKRQNRINKNRFELFNLMSKIVVKNINNYLKLTTNSSAKEESYTAEEMQNEAFLIMIRCIEKFNLKNGNCFYFYLNKAYSRAFYKMSFQSVRNKNNFEKVAANIIYRQPRHTNEHYSMDLLIHQMKLDEFETIVLNSKLLGQSKQDFLELNKVFTSSKYQKCNLKIKSIMQKLIENGEL